MIFDSFNDAFFCTAKFLWDASVFLITGALSLMFIVIVTGMIIEYLINFVKQNLIP